MRGVAGDAVGEQAVPDERVTGVRVGADHGVCGAVQAGAERAVGVPAFGVIGAEVLEDPGEVEEFAGVGGGCRLADDDVADRNLSSGGYAGGPRR
ncbi:hypothetical protein GCM10010305_54890 [Streptomyces termitum]|uniref:Uncharacterized protein n=1 Tax=Streptomyces termitum TaxID=67368 RepID=A0A918T826_9ACTN|nr:hypothetical protein GCM10010305_54890 [Streptomyces termitum]